MIPTQAVRVVTSGGVTASAPFGISAPDTAHIMSILRDMYSDRVLAVLREYSANAWDAHNEFGHGDRPISVTLPMDGDLNLRIRDYGPGLSVDGVLTVYNQYGLSSKRGTNLAVGQLGIGSKSAFCYSDSFTITSWHDSYKRIFIAVIDQSNMGKIDLVYEEACDPTETGIEIQIAVKPGDVPEFHNKARTLFRHYKVRPEINIDLPPPPPRRLELASGNLRSSMEGGDWLAIMGCVPYRVNTAQLDTSLIGKHLTNIVGELYFAIGEVDMAPNREELKYTDRTRATLIEKMNGLVDEFIEQTMMTIESSEYTPWEKRLRAQVLNQLGLPVPEQWKEITDHSVKVEYMGFHFTLIHNKSVSTRISVEAGTRILIDDTSKELIGYHLQFSDWVMRPAEGVSFDLAKHHLEEALEKAKLSGIQILRLSTLPWTAPYRKPPKTNNPKHKVSTFKLVPLAAHSSPWSKNWSVEKRIPDKSDVFVLVRNFRALNYKSFFSEYKSDRNLINHFGGDMPEVYGYKSTERKPIDASTIPGTPYEEWRRTLGAGLTTAENLELIDGMYWTVLGDQNFVSMPDPHDRSIVEAAFGPLHLITKTLDQQAAYSLKYQGMSASKRDAVMHLAKRIGLTFASSSAKLAVDEIYRTYPLLEITRIVSLWDYRHQHKWHDYVRTIDRLNEHLASFPTSTTSTPLPDVAFNGLVVDESLYPADPTDSIISTDLPF